MANEQTKTLGIDRDQATRSNCNITALDAVCLYGLTERILNMLGARTEKTPRWQQLYVLSLIKDNPGITYKQIRRYYGAAKGALTTVITEHTSNGCLTTQQDEKDGRRQRYFITEIGERYLAESLAVVNGSIEPYNRVLPSGDRYTLWNAVQSLNSFVYGVDKRIYDSDDPYAVDYIDPFNR